MKCILFVFVALSLALALPAQTMVGTYITPLGAEFFPGNSSSGVSFGPYPQGTRTQQIDLGLVGQPIPVIRFIGWRQNNASSGAAKMADAQVIMSHADYATVTSNFAGNYKDAPVTVFTRKTVNLPDWSINPVNPPAPFTAILPFDVPFLYNRVDALLWDLAVDNNPGGTYSMDWVSSMTHTYGNFPADLGTGCTTANGRMGIRTALRAAANLEFGVALTNGPASAAAVLMLGVQDPAWTLPGFCATIHAAPVAFLTLPNTDAQGNILLNYLAIAPWNPVLAGVDLFTQAFAMDASQPGVPIAFTQGQKNPTPVGNSTGTIPINCKRSFSTASATAPTGSTPSVSAVPTLYGF